MPVKISNVEKDSAAFKKGIRAGCSLLTVNSRNINDVLDYRFYLSEKKISIEFQDGSGKVKRIKIKKEEYEDIGLEFETYLMDEKRRCKNKCIFCFIDQLPKGMRESLYFKDDDSRLSFLFGNYITLTNLTQREVDRIIEMHISPVNISVHTMNPELRVEMMANPNAGKALDIIYALADNSIKMNAQLVLCPGINDGAELEYSLEKLSGLYPNIQSIAAVPVGKTKFREGLREIASYDKQTAAEVIDIIEAFGDNFKKKHNTRLAFPADEFYLKAQRDMPGEEFYEEYSQLENGVGLCAYLESEFMRTLKKSGYKLKKPRRITVATGVSAYGLIKKLSEKACDKFDGLEISVIPIKNFYFGESINVAGLLTGSDLISQLKGLELGDELLIPRAALRSEGDMFLDGVTTEMISEELNIKITPVSNDGAEMLEKMTGE